MMNYQSLDKQLHDQKDSPLIRTDVVALIGIIYASQSRGRPARRHAVEISLSRGDLIK